MILKVDLALIENTHPVIMINFCLNGKGLAYNLPWVSIRIFEFFYFYYLFILFYFYLIFENVIFIIFLFYFIFVNELRMMQNRCCKQKKIVISILISLGEGIDILFLMKVS